ncbi:piRNA biogenesis protein EXD1 isoform X2 [Nelusetta ayraudi]|uniref:piRNA biogenesis protein EXD1 isoform X2 n=1 Tax=Nelusetta ayraudi TaxID=303726 RepID=UPI003F6E4A97
MEIIKFLYALKGKCVKLTLRNSSYVGFVCRINPNKTLIFVDVVGDGCKIPGSKLFFGREILNVEIVHEGRTCSGTVHDTLDGPVAQKAYMKKVMLDDDESEEDCVNFVVVDEFQGKFVPAVAHIKRQYAIGVGADGVDLFKNGRLCWLQIATKHKIYLFDILLLGARAFKNGLSQILGNKHILKIIHNCRVIASSLNCQFGVKLSNVFDTQVADVMYFYSETGGFLPDRVSTLEQVASLHLKIPSSQVLALQMKSKVGQESALELPDELRKLEQMHNERQQWACEHYAITERGLLTRFGPQPSPETRQQEDKEAGSRQPASTRRPATVKVCPAPTCQPVSPRSVAAHSSLKSIVSPDSVDQDLKATMAARNDLRSGNISIACPGGTAKRLLERLDRGRVFGQPQSPAPAQSAGRGFLLHMSQAQVSRYSPSA